MAVLVPKLLGELALKGTVLAFCASTIALAYIIYSYVQRQHQHQVRY